jgi:hypothetical protein
MDCAKNLEIEKQAKTQQRAVEPLILIANKARNCVLQYTIPYTEHYHGIISIKMFVFIDMDVN